MKSRFPRFNTYLVLLCVACSSGCQTTRSKETTVLRLHLETNTDGTDRNQTILISRKEPFPVNVEKLAFLTELNVQEAHVVDALGGFQLMIQFDRQGTWLLEQYSTAARGKRIAVFSEFGQLRWLAAPLLAKTISDGLFVFTPDATREEAERIVRGLRTVAREVASGRR